jgi:hypothetical protein
MKICSLIRYHWQRPLVLTAICGCGGDADGALCIQAREIGKRESPFHVRSSVASQIVGTG